MAAIETASTMNGVTPVVNGSGAADGKITVKVILPGNIERSFQFQSSETIGQAKQKVLDSISPLNDPLNYGLFLPPSINRMGKFMGEDRMVREFGLVDGDGTTRLILCYKRRMYSSQVTDKKIKQAQSRSNIKSFLEAVKAGDADRVTRWLDKLIDPNIHDKQGETPLGLAVRSLTGPRCRATLLALSGGGAHLDFRALDSFTALHRAVAVANADAVDVLLDLGVSPNALNKDNLTPLGVAIRSKTNEHIVRRLLLEHSIINVPDSNGDCELHIVCRSPDPNNMQIASALIEYGVDLNALNNSRDTPLHIAAKFGALQCARILALRGANRNLRNASGETAQECALHNNQHNVAELLANWKDEDVVPVRDPPVYNNRRSSRALPSVRREVYRRTSIGSVFAPPDRPSTVNDVSAGLGLQNGDSHTHLPDTGRRMSTPSIIPVPVANNNYAAPPNANADAKTDEGWKIVGNQRVRQQDITVIIQRGPRGYGFVLRGAKPPASNPKITRLAFIATPLKPGLAFLDKINAGEPASQVGLCVGDFVLQVNGENVTDATHDYIVERVKASRDGRLLMKVARIQSEPYSPPSPAPERVPTPVAERVPTPASERVPTPAPERVPTPAAERVPTPAPERTQTPTPAPERAPSPAPALAVAAGVHSELAPAYTGSPVPPQAQTPSPASPTSQRRSASATQSRVESRSLANEPIYSRARDDPSLLRISTGLRSNQSVSSSIGPALGAQIASQLADEFEDPRRYNRYSYQPAPSNNNYYALGNGTASLYIDDNAPMPPNSGRRTPVMAVAPPQLRRIELDRPYEPYSDETIRNRLRQNATIGPMNGSANMSPVAQPFIIRSHLRGESSSTLLSEQLPVATLESIPRLPVTPPTENAPVFDGMREKDHLATHSLIRHVVPPPPNMPAPILTMAEQRAAQKMLDDHDGRSLKLPPPDYDINEPLESASPGVPYVLTGVSQLPPAPPAPAPTPTPSLAAQQHANGFISDLQRAAIEKRQRRTLLVNESGELLATPNGDAENNPRRRELPAGVTREHDLNLKAALSRRREVIEINGEENVARAIESHINQNRTSVIYSYTASTSPPPEQDTPRPSNGNIVPIQSATVAVSTPPPVAPKSGSSTTSPGVPTTQSNTPVNAAVIPSVAPKPSAAQAAPKTGVGLGQAASSYFTALNPAASKPTTQQTPATSATPASTLSTVPQKLDSTPPPEKAVASASSRPQSLVENGSKPQPVTPTLTSSQLRETNSSVSKRPVSTIGLSSIAAAVQAARAADPPAQPTVTSPTRVSAIETSSPNRTVYVAGARKSVPAVNANGDAPLAAKTSAPAPTPAPAPAPAPASASASASAPSSAGNGKSNFKQLAEALRKQYIDTQREQYRRLDQLVTSLTANTITASTQPAGQPDANTSAMNGTATYLPAPPPNSPLKTAS